MNLKLDIYKQPKLEFTLKQVKRVNKKIAKIEFEEELGLSPNDVLWSDQDREQNNYNQMLVISTMIQPGTFTITTPEGIPIRKLRKFDVGEKFKLIASFKPENK